MKHAIKRILMLTLALSMLTIVALGVEDETAVQAGEADYAAALADAESVEAVSDPFDDELAAEKLSLVSTYSVGDYNITESEINDYYYQGDVLIDDCTVSGTVYGYDLDWFTFTLPRQSMITLLTVTDTNALWYNLYDSTGENVITSGRTSEYRGDGIYGGNILCELPAGTYNIVFFSSDNSYMNYMFYFDYAVTYLNTPTTSLSLNANTGKPVLSWSSVLGAESYEVWRAVGSGSYQKIASGYGTAFTDTSAQPGQACYYRVRAVGEYATSDYSAARGIICDCARPVVNIKLNGDGKPTISWNAVDGAGRYYIYRSTSQWSGYQYWTYTTKTSFTNSSVEPGETYYYQVCAYAMDGSSRIDNSGSAYSTPVGVTVPEKKLARPVVSIKLNGNDKPTLNWAAVDGADRYYIYRSTEQWSGYKYLTWTSKTSFTNTTVEEGETYWYQICAYKTDANGIIADSRSPYSTPKGVTVPAELDGPLDTPVVSITTSKSSGKPTLSWDKVENADRYYIYRSTNRNGGYKYLTWTTKTGFTNSSTEAGVAYYYQVRAVALNNSGAVNAATWSGYSSPKGITCDCARPVVDIALNSAGKPTISWDAVAGADRYYIYRSTSQWSGYKYLTWTSKTGFTNASVEPDVTYYYQVCAYAMDGTTRIDNSRSAYSTPVGIKVN